VSIILTAILLVGLAILGICIYALIKIGAFACFCVAFITAPDEKTPSPLAQFIDLISHTAGHAIAVEAKTTLMGKASAVARTEQGVLADMTGDLLTSQSPVLGGILDMFPSLKKRVLKNPELTQFIMSKLAGGLKPAGDNNHSSDYANEISKYRS
jgi:hypothetical protein